MHIPLVSVVTLGTELLVTASVYTIIWRAYQYNHFMWKFTTGILLYELLFNITYMATRFFTPLEEHLPAKLNPYETVLGAFHGIFSLVMFITLIIFFWVAWRAYRQERNFFRAHQTTTIVFATAWGVSILSGIALFTSLYIL